MLFWLYPSERTEYRNVSSVAVLSTVDSQCLRLFRVTDLIAHTGPLGQGINKKSVYKYKQTSSLHGLWRACFAKYRNSPLPAFNSSFSLSPTEICCSLDIFNSTDLFIISFRFVSQNTASLSASVFFFLKL